MTRAKFALAMACLGAVLLAATGSYFLVARLHGHDRQQPAASFPATFSGAFTGLLVAQHPSGGRLTWDIDANLADSNRGAVEIDMTGTPTAVGISVESGQVRLQSGKAACAGTIRNVTNNLVTADCAVNGGRSSPLTVNFKVQPTNQVTGTLWLGEPASVPQPGLIITPQPTAPARASQPPPAPGHVFVIVMENRSYEAAVSSPYVSSLIQQYAVATSYQAVAHPSLPNYLALTSGSTWGISDDSYHLLPAGGLGTQLTGAGVSWKAYAEGFTGDCQRSSYPYALKHNPFAYYGGQCPANVVSMDLLGGDLAGQPPLLSWIIPGMCNDGHDCPSATADTWLRSTVSAIVASPAWKQNGVLFITWDEADGSASNRVATLIVAPNLVSHSTSLPADHYSLLATIEDRLGVSRLGEAASAQPITEVFR